MVHLEQDAKLADFPYTSVSKSIDYGEVKLGERGVFNLPKHVRSYACRDAQNEDCLRNEIKFDNCRKFTVETKIITTQP